MGLTKREADAVQKRRERLKLRAKNWIVVEEEEEEVSDASSAEKPRSLTKPRLCFNSVAGLRNKKAGGRKSVTI